MAPAEDDISIDEKRVYAGSAGRTDAYVATGSGIVRVSLSADKIGAFDMVARDAARDVAVLARDERADSVVAATPEGLSVAAVGDDPAFEAVDDDPAVAVGAAGGRDGVIAAREDGAIERVEFEDGGTVVASTARLGTVADPRAVDGALVAAADGVYRIVGGGLTDVGLDDARDVAGAGMPLAATGAGLYWLGNGWMTALKGAADAVAADGDGHAMAVADGDLLVHSAAGEWDDETWAVADLPVDETAVALGYGRGVSVAVTDAGTLCVDAGDGWRHQVVGVRDVNGVALAVVE
ncbi:HVO_0234 family beta-propeller protein [Halorubrum xinjiangense]|uniref:HVO_0234 family beta-propeller protein n=1 Tax=Halorubrum xinjiangense TaxID=261291 RepID=UPI003C7020A9